MEFGAINWVISVNSTNSLNSGNLVNPTNSVKLFQRMVGFGAINMLDLRNSINESVHSGNSVNPLNSAKLKNWAKCIM